MEIKKRRGSRMRNDNIDKCYIILLCLRVIHEFVRGRSSMKLLLHRNNVLLWRY
jgi:hypothetical protein